MIFVPLNSASKKPTGGYRSYAKGNSYSRNSRSDIEEGLDDYYDELEDEEDSWEEVTQEEEPEEDDVEYEEELVETPEPETSVRKQARPEFLDRFTSSNLKSVAYDPSNKQLWIRFLDNSIYTYYDISMDIWKGFWSAPSKGHYFWENIRRDPSIVYQKLSSALRWIPVNHNSKVLRRGTQSLQATRRKVSGILIESLYELLDYLKESLPEQRWSLDEESATLSSRNAYVRFEEHRKTVDVFVQDRLLGKESAVMSRLGTLVPDTLGLIFATTLQ